MAKKEEKKSKRISIDEGEQADYKARQKARGTEGYKPDGKPLDPEALAHSSGPGKTHGRRGAKQPVAKKPAKKVVKKK